MGTLLGTVAGRGCDMGLSLSLPVSLTLLTLLPPSQQACPGLYPHPSQCDKFYQCDSHSSYLFNCPQGTLFDVNIGVCNHKYLVKCQHESQTATRPTTSKPRPTTTLSQPSPPLLTQPPPPPPTTSTSQKPKPSTSSTTTTSSSTITEFTTSKEIISSSSETLLTDDNNIFIDLSRPSTTSSVDPITDINIPAESVTVIPPGTSGSTAAPAEPEWSVSVSSLYPCSQPGYYSEESSCSQFFVCKEVAPGLLSADRIFSCPDRYLFDPVTRLCQREAKVSCDVEETPNLFYSGLGLFTVKLQEEDLDTFFSQDLLLPGENPDSQYPSLPYVQPSLPYVVPPLRLYYPGLAPFF